MIRERSGEKAAPSGDEDGATSSKYFSGAAASPKKEKENTTPPKQKEDDPPTKTKQKEDDPTAKTKQKEDVPPAKTKQDDAPAKTKQNDPPTKTKQKPSEVEVLPPAGASNSDGQLWVEKYRPRSLKQLIGQQTPGSCANRLLNWLRTWHHNMDQGKKRPASVGFTRGAHDDGALFKAALLSGPPGIGKTTTAHLVCQELEFSFVELNASDTRSKKSLQTRVSLQAPTL